MELAQAGVGERLPCAEMTEPKQLAQPMLITD